MKIKPTPPPQGEPQTQFAIGQAAAPPADTRTNAEGDCLWCGKRLKPSRIHSSTAADAGLDGSRLFGAYADGRFCTMRCGYAFGVWAAHLGFRLAPRELPPEAAPPE
jgi:hypothetical protein